MLSNGYQLFDEQGRMLHGKTAPKSEVLRKGLLHGAAHVWVWRRRAGQIEVLLQQRADSMMTFPGMLDISAAGHIDPGEEALLTAIRECREELNLEVTDKDLHFVMVLKRVLPVTNTELIENECVWVYLFELKQTANLTLEAAEVSAITWKNLASFKSDIANPVTHRQYVPHSLAYLAVLFEALDVREKALHNT